MATPRMAAGIAIRDPGGRILLVRPTYKDGWDIPGGYVEPGESPAEACRRELKE
jgi:8-oxo-dGTP diphosphatase